MNIILLQNELHDLLRMLNLGVIDIACYRRNVASVLTSIEYISGGIL